jgi:hypothetical protein
VGAGAGPVPSGIRLLVEPVPGVPEFEGKLNDWPGVGAGVGPVPLGIEFWGVLVDVPGAPEVAPLAPALPELPDEPPCPKASEAWVNRTTVTNASVFGRITFLPLGANILRWHSFHGPLTSTEATFEMLKLRKGLAQSRTLGSLL